MPDLDLEPKDYKATPIKGEPVILPGGLRRLAVYAVVLAAVLIAGWIWKGPATAISDWLWGLWH